jgi:CBS domain-containing protein
MQTEPLTLKPQNTVDTVQDLFERHSIHHVPIIDDQGFLKGIISKSDMRQISYGYSLFTHHQKSEHNVALYQSVLVRDIMTSNPESLGPENTLLDAVNLFMKNAFHAIPVVDNENKLVGIVTTYDLLALVLD